jgi:soluble cytochrome b562
VIIAFVKKCRDVFRMLGVAQTRAVREAFGGIRREGLGNKKTALTEEVKELEGKLEGAEDEEMKGLKEKYQEYVGQLDEIKKEKD